MIKIISINIYTRLLRDIFLVNFTDEELKQVISDIEEYEKECFNISTLDGMVIYNDIIRDCYRIENDEQYITAISIPLDFSDDNNRVTHKDHRLSWLLHHIRTYESDNKIKNRPKTSEDKQRFMLRKKKILSIEDAKLMGYEYFTDCDMDSDPENLHAYRIDSEDDIKEATWDGVGVFDIIKQEVKQLGANALMGLIFNDIYEDDSYPNDEDYATDALEGCEDLLKQLTDKINQNMAKVKLYRSTGIKLHIPKWKQSE